MKAPRATAGSFAAVADTGVGSDNLGDHIIMEAVQREVADLAGGRAVMTVATHTPLGRRGRRVVRTSDFTLVGGSNLLPTHPTWRQLWRVTPQPPSTRKFVLVGVGFGAAPGRLTAPYLRTILHPTACHSGRDVRTHEFLTAHGFDSVLTGCVTTWRAAPEPRAGRSGRAIVVLNHTLGDARRDEVIVEGVRDTYPHVEFWHQSPHDLSYVRSGSVPPDEVCRGGLDALAAALASGADLVTTRLHAALFGMRRGARVTLFSLDGRVARTAGPVSAPWFTAPDSAAEVGGILRREAAPAFQSRSADVAEWFRRNADLFASCGAP